MKTYFRALAACFGRLLRELTKLPATPRSLFYERWEIAFFEERRHLLEQAQRAHEARAMGVEQTFLGWALPEKPAPAPALGRAPLARGRRRLTRRRRERPPTGR